MMKTAKDWIRLNQNAGSEYVMNALQHTIVGVRVETEYVQIIAALPQKVCHI